MPEVAGVRDLTDPGFMSTISDERMRRSIRGGRPPTMPSFPHFSEPTLKVLVAYVRSLSQPELVLAAALAWPLRHAASTIGERRGRGGVAGQVRA
ncbi:hypothetical protein [Nannocystis pusilla]|uniref:hypothetical protein n=1 Tax=Nannocystis pusilla TaxID=889268 RepID=UPI003B82BC1E